MEKKTEKKKQMKKKKATLKKHFSSFIEFHSLFTTIAIYSIYSYTFIKIVFGGRSYINTQ